MYKTVRGSQEVYIHPSSVLFRFVQQLPSVGAWCSPYDWFSERQMWVVEAEKWLIPWGIYEVNTYCAFVFSLSCTFANGPPFMSFVVWKLGAYFLLFNWFGVGFAHDIAILFLLKIVVMQSKPKVGYIPFSCLNGSTIHAQCDLHWSFLADRGRSTFLPAP